jgi:hypothetical protein
MDCFTARLKACPDTSKSNSHISNRVSQPGTKAEFFRSCEGVPWYLQDFSAMPYMHSA